MVKQNRMVMIQQENSDFLINIKRDNQYTIIA